MGQATKHRACPAVGRDISSADCGNNRHGCYACPPTCEFNPFALANYTALLATEDQLDAQTLKQLLDEMPTVPENLRRAANSQSGHALHAATVWQLFFATDESGLTFAARWERAGFPGLRNDQRVFLRGKMRMRVALIEVQGVRDELQINAVDLLDPAGPALRLVDRSMAARVGRFDVFLTWLYPLPHFWRMSGTGIGVPEFGPFHPAAIVRECVAHLGGPAEPEARRRWLAEHFVRVDAAITATAHERRRRMLAGLDAQWGAATYELVGSFAACRAVLARVREADEDSLNAEELTEGFGEALVWFEPGKKASPRGGAGLAAGGRRVLGRVLLAPDRIRVEAMGAARLEELRKQFETRLGAKVRFSKERRDNLGGRMAAEEPAAEVALVPPRLLEHTEKFELSTSRVPLPAPGTSPADHQAMLRQQFHREFADSPVPALDGKTPRQAAGDFLLRPRLVELMKTHVRQTDAQNLRSGRRDDINWLLRDLGLVEIDFPPPPPRPALADEFEPADDEAGDYDDEGNFTETAAAGTAERPDPGPLPLAPLTFEMSLVRLQAALDAFEMAADGLGALDHEAPTLIDDIADLTADWVSDDEFSLMVPFLLQTWFALVPRGRRPVLRLDVMAAALASDSELLSERGRPGLIALEQLLGRCRQPHFFQALVEGVMEAAQHAPKSMQPSPEATIGIVLALKAVIDELDFALRR